MSRTTLRPTLAALSLIIAVVAAVVLPAGAASAAAYRYWGFFQLHGSTWAFATKGPDQVTPPDGSVEGWRFAVAGESDSRTPRASATFDQLCGSTAAESGKKRVGLVIDYGRAADAEDGAAPCPNRQVRCRRTGCHQRRGAGRGRRRAGREGPRLRCRQPPCHRLRRGGQGGQPRGQGRRHPGPAGSGHPERGRQREWRGPSKGQRF